MEKRKKSKHRINSYHNLAMSILKESKEPMFVSEILKIILKKKEN